MNPFAGFMENMIVCGAMGSGETCEKKEDNSLHEIKKKECYFCVEKINKIDCTDERKLRRYVTERGKIIPRRITGVCARHQRTLSRAIKKAREIAVLPYTSESHR